MSDRPRRYIQRPVQFDAMRITHENMPLVAAWIKQNGGRVDNEQSLDYLRIHCRGEIACADVGDYILKRAQGVFDLCSPTDFERFYELVDWEKDKDALQETA